MRNKKNLSLHIKEAFEGAALAFKKLSISLNNLEDKKKLENKSKYHN